MADDLGARLALEGIEGPGGVQGADQPEQNAEEHEPLEENVLPEDQLATDIEDGVTVQISEEGQRLAQVTQAPEAEEPAEAAGNEEETNLVEAVALGEEEGGGQTALPGANIEILV